MAELSLDERIAEELREKAIEFISERHEEPREEFLYGLYRAIEGMEKDVYNGELYVTFGNNRIKWKNILEGEKNQQIMLIHNHLQGFLDALNNKCFDPQRADFEYTEANIEYKKGFSKGEKVLEIAGPAIDTYK